MFPSADTMRFCHQLDYATSGILVTIIVIIIIIYPYLALTGQVPTSRPHAIVLSCLVYFYCPLILASLRLTLRYGPIIGRPQMLSQSNSVKGFHHIITECLFLNTSPPLLYYFPLNQSLAQLWWWLFQP